MVQELNAAGRAVEVVALAKPRGGSGAIPCRSGSAQSRRRRSALPATGSGVRRPTRAAGRLALAFERVGGRRVAPGAEVARARRPRGAADGAAPGVAGARRPARQPRAAVPRLQRPARDHGVKVEAGEHGPLRALAGKAVKQDKLVRRAGGTARQAEGRRAR